MKLQNLRTVNFFFVKTVYSLMVRRADFWHTGYSLSSITYHLLLSDLGMEIHLFKPQRGFKQGEEVNSIKSAKKSVKVLTLDLATWSSLMTLVEMISDEWRNWLRMCKNK